MVTINITGMRLIIVSIMAELNHFSEFWGPYSNIFMGILSYNTFHLNFSSHLQKYLVWHSVSKHWKSSLMIQVIYSYGPKLMMAPIYTNISLVRLSVCVWIIISVRLSVCQLHFRPSVRLSVTFPSVCPSVSYKWLRPSCPQGLEFQVRSTLKF